MTFLLRCSSCMVTSCKTQFSNRSVTSPKNRWPDNVICSNTTSIEPPMSTCVITSSSKCMNVSFVELPTRYIFRVIHGRFVSQKLPFPIWTVPPRIIKDIATLKTWAYDANIPHNKLHRTNLISICHCHICALNCLCELCSLEFYPKTFVWDGVIFITALLQSFNSM